MKNLLFIFLIFQSFNLDCQVAGKSVFSFLNLNPSAKSLALGSNFISSNDNDISSAWQNPAILTPKMSNHFFTSYNNYISDINSGYFAYARHIKNKGNFGLSILYVDYGKFNGYSSNGVYTGTFTANDQCINLSYSNQIKPKIRVGANLKYIYSIYESYVSNGISSDLSAIYTDTAKLLNITAFARNIGFQAIPYSQTERQNLPFELAFSISKKLKYLPFRYHLIFNQLQKPDMRYTITETNERDENGNPKTKKMTMGDNILRHFALGGELNFSKNFVLRFGYNHQRRKEISPEQKRGTSGFSWGLGFKISKFILSYGSSSMFPGYNANQFSLLVNFSDFRKN